MVRGGTTTTDAMVGTLLINLPRHTRRYAAVTQQLAAAGILFERAPTVDGHELTTLEREQNVTFWGRKLMTPGMIGCFLSHRNCWKIVRERQDALMVLEDDVVLAPAFNDALASALAEVSAHDEAWDVLLIGALGCVHPRGWSHYGLNIVVGLMAGGLRRPRRVSPTLHVPCAPSPTRSPGPHAPAPRHT